jgi:hypothetical protein
MGLVLGFTHQTGVRLAELAFLLLLIAGLWLVVGQMGFKMRWGQTLVAGVLLSAAGLILIVAVHWGHFG